VFVPNGTNITSRLYQPAAHPTVDRSDRASHAAANARNNGVVSSVAEASRLNLFTGPIALLQARTPALSGVPCVGVCVRIMRRPSCPLSSLLSRPTLRCPLSPAFREYKISRCVSKRLGRPAAGCMTQRRSAVAGRPVNGRSASTYDRQPVSHRRHYCSTARACRGGEFLSAAARGCETSSVFMSAGPCLLWASRRRYKAVRKGGGGEDGKKGRWRK